VSQALKPNIVILLLDCVRADHLGCYGHAGGLTPQIDALADEGMLFANAISSSVWTLESVASLFSGLYPSQHQTYYGHAWLDPAIPTLAGWLGDLGYETRSATRNPWIAAETGLTRGFHTVTDLRMAARLGPLAAWGRRLAAGHDAGGGLVRAKGCQHLQGHGAGRPRSRAPMRWARRAWQGVNQRLEARMPDAGAARINRSAIDWLDRRDPHHPFFLFIDYMEAHGPYMAPPEERWRFLPTGISPEEALQVPLQSWVYHASPERLDARARAVIRALYAAALAYLDRQVGALTAALRSRGLLDDTLLVIMADHGENLGDHGMLGHNFCAYDTLARVPLICRLPGVFDGGRRAPQLVQNVDIFPTIEGLLDERAPRTEQARQTSLHSTSRSPAFVERLGRDLRPLASSAGPAPNTVVRATAPDADLNSEERAFVEYLAPNLDLVRGHAPEADVSELDRSWRAVRRGHWKLLLASDGTRELYDLSADPEERSNRVAAEPERAAAMEAELRAWVERVDGGVASVSGPDGPSENDWSGTENEAVAATMRERLEAFGYL
jgi:arylsulfatase A-like enzyme